MRPGFLGRWIEFNIIGTEDLGSHITSMRHRFLKQSLNSRSAQFDKQIMKQTDLIKEQQEIEKAIRSGGTSGA